VVRIGPLAGALEGENYIMRQLGGLSKQSRTLFRSTFSPESIAETAHQPTDNCCCRQLRTAAGGVPIRAESDIDWAPHGEEDTALSQCANTRGSMRCISRGGQGGEEGGGGGGGGGGGEKKKKACIDACISPSCPVVPE